MKIKIRETEEEILIDIQPQSQEIVSTKWEDGKMIIEIGNPELKLKYNTEITNQILDFTMKDGDFILKYEEG